jgi:hypothetical protein
MIKKTIQYHDFEGNLREDDFYFHLTQVELTKINSDPSLPGGLEESVARASKNKDAGELLRIVDLMISRSYGVKLPDGGFVKRNSSGLPLYELFVNTEAYDNLLTELIQDEEGIVNFLTGCLTKDAQDKVRAEFAKRKEEELKNVKLTPVETEGSVV